MRTQAMTYTLAGGGYPTARQPGALGHSFCEGETAFGVQLVCSWCSALQEIVIGGAFPIPGGTAPNSQDAPS